MEPVKIYVLIDPETKEIRYVGKTKKTLLIRLAGHCGDKSATHKNIWVNSLRKKDIKPIIELIEECTEDNWEERERYWIAFYRNKGIRLTNSTDGGQGSWVKGRLHTEESKKKMIATCKNPNSKNYNKGCNYNPESAEKKKKLILQYDLDGNFMKEWKGIAKTARELKIHNAVLTGCLQGKNKSGGGFMWTEFKENFPLKILPYRRECRPILQYTLTNILIKRWDCITNIKEELNIPMPTIYKNLQNYTKTSHGFIWKYE